MQLVLSDIYHVLRPILSLESDDERSLLLADALGLLDSLLPSQPEDCPEELFIGTN